MRPHLRLALCVTALLPLASIAQAQTAAQMSFFVSSEGSGNGGNLGGLQGADALCQRLAGAAGSSKTWRAYLSTQGSGAVNAKDRIGAGPWQNAKGEVIATSVADLHSANNKINKVTGLTEKGQPVNGRGDTPNMHDILTGSQEDGTAFPAGEDRTCNNWTSASSGAAMVGHHDRTGLNDQPPAKSWNTSHPSRGEGGGCSVAALKGTGGDGRLYCFATN
jgi:hypothetical protein